MADNAKKPQNEEPEIDPLYLMEEIIDKLKLLDYENHFLRKK